ncbi:uncharacterized protein L969DRAFT_22073 [Mixia osmundae IAM 14324]|uniref:Sds3-like-domain-containing protein n=1 Tax=Mixia osmundae (strain CBS 9802 / IAM 14324 / JCM 22182 / KY 12970) TaxID=764103 RepID=G7DY61_MIXOS|nr:uncharacterized protein L969DRAFT_22073 [Mixia osmundae IAM 14324]KEI41423.1 hypothetical protein L969DRAFT_22073 [Mixia osmundae IAM 14324]GAA95521.1 hypothetical protein E5Q_02176 [Mixia osmundae IAM 14324]
MAPPRRTAEAARELWNEDIYQHQWEAPHGQQQGFPTESKRDKRRRDMIERIERLRRDGIERREPIFHELLNQIHESHLALLAQPAPTHPEYLLGLHDLSVKRDHLLLGVKAEARHGLETAKRLYETEVDRIEEEYEQFKRGIKDRLIEACEERTRKLREEKESLEINLDALFDPQPRPHATRRLRHGAPLQRASPYPTSTIEASYDPPPNAIGLPHPSMGGHGLGLDMPDTLDVPPLSNGTGHLDPGYLYSVLPSSPLLTSMQLSGPGSHHLAANHQMTLLSALQSSTGHQRYRKRGQAPGLPGPTGAMHIVPGRYDQTIKPLQALRGLAGDELGEDIEAMRRKKKRTGGTKM